RYFADEVRAAVRKLLPNDKVLTRENILALMPEEPDLASCEGGCEVETGRKLSADVVVSARMTRLGKTYKLMLKAHRTSDATLLGAATASGSTPELLERNVARALQELFPDARQ